MAIEQEHAPKPEFSFNGDPFDVADKIKGARVNVGDKNLVVKDAEGFTRQENERGQYRAIARQQPGMLMGLPYRNSTLPLISTQDGSCVLIRSVEITEEGISKTIKGPGRVADEMGLRKNDIFNMVVEDPIERVLKVERPQ